MKLLIALTLLLCGFGSASTSADTSGSRRKTQQQRELEREIQELIDSLRLDPDWNRPHWHPPVDPDRIRDLLKR